MIIFVISSSVHSTDLNVRVNMKLLFSPRAITNNHFCWSECDEDEERTIKVVDVIIRQMNSFAYYDSIVG